MPNLADPQSWNRYSYVNNNPLRYTDPSGHCIWDLCIVEGIGVVELVLAVSAIFAGTIAIENHDAMVEGIDSVSQYVSKKVTDRVAAFEQNVQDVNSGKGLPRKSCKEDVVFCIVSGAVVAGLVAYGITHGGCDEPESNTRCPNNTPTPTQTQTPIPTSTSTSTPTSTSTATPTYTPTNRPTTTPTRIRIVPTPSLSVWERRLEQKGLLR